MRGIVETRVIEWVAPGYEQSYTQYQVTEDGDLWITQFALRANTASHLTGLPVRSTHLSVESAQRHAQSLIENRTEDGDAREVIVS